VLGESFLQAFEWCSGSNGNGEVGPGMFGDFVQPRRRKMMSARRADFPSRFLCRRRAEWPSTGIADKSKRFCKFRFVARHNDKFRLDTRDDISVACRVNMLRAQERNEPVASEE